MELKEAEQKLIYWPHLRGIPGEEQVHFLRVKSEERGL